DPSPTKQIEKWLHEAVEAGHPEATAMNLATITPQGDPATRVVLVKGIDTQGLVFFTNYNSEKGRDLEKHPRAAGNLFWPLLERQIRVTGTAGKISREDSEAYFRSRPRESQLGAWASDQSTVLEGRGELERRLEDMRSRFSSGEVPCP